MNNPFRKLTGFEMLLIAIVIILAGFIIHTNPPWKWQKKAEQKVYWGVSGFQFQEDTVLRKGVIRQINIGFKEDGTVIWTAGAEVQPPPPQEAPK